MVRQGEGGELGNVDTSVVAWRRARRCRHDRPVTSNLIGVLVVENCRILVLLLLCGLGAASAQSRTVALTFDDLPLAAHHDSTQAESITSAILHALDRLHAPAIGFVIGKRVSEIGEQRGVGLLREWLHHGYDLGNHSFSHRDFNVLTVEQFQLDVIADEAILKSLLGQAGRTLHYFRFPYNHTGDTKRKHDALAGFLKERGYTVARCTIDNEDYLFNRAYLRMLANGDGAAAKRLREEYLAYTSTEIDYYSGLHKQVFGREVPQVMLLRVNRLNADVIDQVLALFAEKRYRFVTLAEAQADAAYQTPDTVVTKSGLMWGYRWAKERGVKVNGRLETEPAAWISEYGQAPPEHFSGLQRNPSWSIV